MPEQDPLAGGWGSANGPLPGLHLLEEDLGWWFERARRDVIEGFEVLLGKHARFLDYLEGAADVPHL